MRSIDRHRFATRPEGRATTGNACKFYAIAKPEVVLAEPLF